MNTIAALSFKSTRSAKIAFGKALKVAKAADEVANTFDHRALTEEEAVQQDAANAAVEAAHVAARAIFDAAAEQGFGFYAYGFSYNGTRDLIAANVD